jgi:hypothetical protein
MTDPTLPQSPHPDEPETEAEAQARYGEMVRHLAARAEFYERFAKFINELRAQEGHDREMIRGALFRWLCEDSESRDNFEEDSSTAADEHDWPDDDSEDEDESEED